MRAPPHSPLWQARTHASEWAYPMTNSEPLLHALRSFAAAMGSSYDLPDVCFQLSASVTDILGVTGAGVSVLARDGKLKFVAATSERIVEIERVQEASQEGPCMAASTQNQPVVVADIADNPDWPTYEQAASRTGLRSMVGFPLAAEGRRVGAMNVYNAEPREWSENDLNIIAVFADMTVAYLARTSELSEARQLTEQLQRALESRIVIEQAKGILANQHGLSVDDAFELLRHHSRSNGLGLSEVAEAVVKKSLTIPRR